jgi:hypothetical protein
MDSEAGPADPEPDPETAAGPRILYVPVHTCAGGTVTIQTGRLPSGQAVGLGFTSPARLAMVFGAWQPWITLHLGALHEMLAPLGISLVRIDPLRSAPRREPRLQRSSGNADAAPLDGAASAPEAPAAAGRPMAGREVARTGARTGTLAPAGRT